jgi:two-component system cell cycle sensor histidine kinase/response regulator CckA
LNTRGDYDRASPGGRISAILALVAGGFSESRTGSREISGTRPDILQKERSIRQGAGLSLRRKTLLILGLTLVGLCAALYVIARATILSRFADVEDTEVRQNLDRVSNAITNEYDLLSTLTRDDSQWDEAYHFVQHPNRSWGETNFPDGTLEGLRLNILIFFNADDEAVHARQFETASHQIAAPDAVVHQLAPLARMARTGGNKGRGGIALLPDGFMLVAAWPVLTSTGRGSPAGALVMGRKLDARELRRLTWATSLQFDIFATSGSELPPDVREAAARLATGNRMLVRPMGRETVAGYKVLSGYDGAAGIVLRVKTPRIIYEEGKASLLYLMGSVLFLGVTSTILSAFLMEKLVLSRLISLSKSVGAVGLGTGLSERVKVEGTDEISALAGSINQMLASLERAERERQVPEAYLEGLFESAPEAVVIVDSHHRIVRVNQEFTRMFGYTLEEARGRQLDRLIVPTSKEPEAESLNSIIEQGRTASLETQRIRKDGTVVDVSILGTPVSIGGGRVAFYAIYRDINERKRSERLQAALYRIAEKASSAEDLNELFRTIHAILQELMYARNCYVALVEPATEMVSFPYFVDEKDVVPPPPHKFRKGLTEYVLRTGRPLLATPQMLDQLVRSGEVEARTGARSRDWMGVPLKQGDTTFGVLTVQTYEPNIRYGEAEKEILTFVSQQVASAVAHRRNQDAMRESESRFRALAETASPAIVIYAKKFYYLNPSAAQMSGYSRNELLAMEDPWPRLIHPDHLPLAVGRSEARLRGEKVPSHYEFKLVRKNGEERWVDFSASAAPIQFAGKPANVAILVDVTERKHAEQLQTALYRIAATTSSADDPQQLFAAIHGIVAELMYAKNFYLALYEAKTDRISFPYFVDEEDSPPEPRPLKKGLTEYILRTGNPLLATPEVFDKLIAQGEVEMIGAPSLDWLGVPLKTGETTFGVLVVQSYTEQRRYGEREKEILTFVSQHVASAIEHKRSQQALRESEVRYRTLVQSALYGIFRWSLEDQFTDVNPALVSILGYDSAADVLGLRMTQDVYVDAKQHGEIISDLLAAGQLRGIEVQWRRQDGKIITVRLSGRSIQEDGRISGFEMIVEDITERRLLEEQLRQAQKMEAVGQLAGGIAHDFNNLLTVIKGNSQLLLEKLHAVDSRRTGVEQIQKATDRAASLIYQLLAFSRKQVIEFRVLDLNSMIANTMQLLRRLLGEHIELTIIEGKDLGRVKADPGQMEQVVMNLALNARDAMADGGNLTIETENVEVDPTYPSEDVSIAPGHYVMLRVTDTGTGMDPDTLAHIFEPFFTTKAVGKGTGLGLSTVYGIVKQSNGFITAQSQPGRGATFRVYLPRVDQAVDAVEVLGPVSQGLQGSETVMVVEDEDGVRSLITMLLARNGYTVLEASNAEEALDLCQNRGSRVHLLITDLVLPRMNGRELAERMSERYPGVRTLFMSGYTDDAALKDGVLENRAAFLQKPFNMETLLHKIREVLGRAAAAH